ncbi:hypothetical protein [Parashewanella tropica]|uniref:hypothetical protein n=1 Tax=Parashewanella tropica TaxID=2547970 RepID=UPI001059AC6C|nr:hypothetical protein [Parashewanella tropica]
MSQEKLSPSLSVISPSLDAHSLQYPIKTCFSGHQVGRVGKNSETIVVHKTTSPSCFKCGWGMTSTSKVYDLTQIPLEHLILKSSEQAITKDTQQALKGFLDQMLKETHSIKGSPQWDRTCHRYLTSGCKIQSMFPTLFSIGLDLHQQISTEAKQQLLAKHKACSMVNYHDARFCDDKFSECGSLPEPIRRQQVLTVPDFTAWVGSEPIDKGRVLDKIIAQHLKKKGLTLANPFVFRGFIAHEYAEKIAKRTMFQDASDSPIIFHGPRTHCLQVCSLLDQKEMSTSDLNLILIFRAWMFFFDSQEAKIPTHYERSNRSYFHGLPQRLTSTTPGGVHLLLLQKQLSGCVSRVLSQGTMLQKRELLALFSIPSEHSTHDVDKDLAFIHEVLCVFEAYIIDSYYRGFSKAGYKDLPMDSVDSYKINSLEALNRKCDYEKICAQLKKGYTVAAIFRRTHSSQPEHRVFDSVEDYQSFYRKMRRFNSFGYITDKHLSSDEGASLKSLLARIHEL